MPKHNHQLVFSMQIGGAITLVIFMLIASFYAGKLVGINSSNFMKITDVKNGQELTTDLAKTNARLEVAETTNKLNLNALEQTRQNIVELEQQIYQQQKQILAYQAVLAKDKPSSNLVIKDLIIQATLKPYIFKYKIVLTRTDKADSLLSGQIQVLIEGSKQGKVKVLSLGDISKLDGYKKNIVFAFKYLYFIPQNNQFAKMVLPPDFTPKKIKIIAYIQGNNKPIIKNFPWSVKSLSKEH